MQLRKNSIATGAAALGALMILVLNGCMVASPEAEGDADGDAVDGAPSTEEGETGTVEQPLFDTATMDATAKLGLISAGTASVVAAYDPLFGAQVEYCGLIVRKANGQYRAGSPVTQGDQSYCKAQERLALGERVVAYYHSHPPSAGTGFSSGDIAQSELKRWYYYVISAKTGCIRKYNPVTNANTQLGCFPGSIL